MDHLFDLFSQCFKGVICFTRFGPCYLGSALNPPICWHRLRALLGLWVWPWMIALTSVCASASPCGLLSTRAVKQVSWVVKTITQNLNIIGVILVFSLLWLYLYWWLLIEIYDCILNAFFYSGSSAEVEKSELQRFSKNFLPILFNVYNQQPKPGETASARMAVLDTIRVYLSITEQAVINLPY